MNCVDYANSFPIQLKFYQMLSRANVMKEMHLKKETVSCSIRGSYGTEKNILEFPKL